MLIRSLRLTDAGAMDVTLESKVAPSIPSCFGSSLEPVAVMNDGISISLLNEIGLISQVETNRDGSVKCAFPFITDQY